MPSSSARAERLLFSCEHGGHRVPAAYAALFAGQSRLLASHRGWDPGALALARALARAARAPLLASTVTRLLVDLNRSPENPRRLGAGARELPPAARERLLERHYRPQRAAVEAAVARAAQGGARTLHVAVHSFTPVWRGRARRVDLGLLYDPARAGERALCRTWAQALRQRAPELRVRRNQPYRGSADGLPTWLRRRFGEDAYLGVELEVSQRLLVGAQADPARLRQLLLAALTAALRGRAGRR
jgi:predicted N-formylglutamate amidohydrolase